MNKQLHRIVFNRLRGQMMAVQETARSACGSETGGSRAATRLVPAVRLRIAAWGVLYMLGLSTSLVLAQTPATLPLTPHATAPAGQRPVIDAAQNGVPIVHIAPPSAAGVSRNQFKQFNVDRNGLVLNNSAGNVQSQLGGWIAGNPQLGYVPARLIVSEVMGAESSLLRGTIEVAGRRADVIIANPNGLLCDGCNFLNTNRAALTTGAPRYDAQGALAGFDVRQGQLTIGQEGLNAGNLEQLDLVARGLVIEGDVWAQNLHILAGANQVLYATLGETPTTTAQLGTGPRPLFAIDLKDLGGMYANQVYLIATEQGLGVNSTGRIAALLGNLQLTVNGDLTLKDTYAKQDIRLASAGKTTLTGLSQSEGVTRIESTGSLVQQGVIDSAQQFSLSAGELDNSGSIIQRGSGSGAQGMDLNVQSTAQNTGTLYSAGDLTLNATTVFDSHGQQLAAGNLLLTANALMLDGSQFATDSRLELRAVAGDARMTNVRLNAAGDFRASARDRLDNAGGFIRSGKDIELAAHSLRNPNGTMLSNGSLHAVVADAIDNSGGRLLGSAAVALTAARVLNDMSDSASALIASDHDTRIQTVGADAALPGLSNLGGVVSGKTLLSIDTRSQGLDNRSGTLVSDSAMTIRAGALDNSSGQIVSRALQDASALLSLEVASLDNRRGLIDAGASLMVGSGAAVLNSQGKMQAGTRTDAASGTGTLTLQSSSLDNTAGYLSSRDALVLATGALINSSDGNTRGVIASSGSSSNLQAQNLVNTGGVISSAGGTTVFSHALDNRGGDISSAAWLLLDTQGHSLDNTAGRVGARTALSIGAGDILNDVDGSQAASIVSEGALALVGTSLSNRGSTVSGAGEVSLGLGAGLLDNRGGTLTSNTRLSLDAGTVGNQSGRMFANRVLDAKAGSFDNSGGVFSAVDRATLQSAGTFNNSGGTVASEGAVDLTASRLDNARGSIQATVTAVKVGDGELLNSKGRIVGRQALTLQNGALKNADGMIASGGALSIDTGGKTLDNSGGTLQSTGNLSAIAGVLHNLGGKLISGSSTSIVVGKLDNDTGEISALRSTPSADGNVGIDVIGQITNNAGRVVAEGDLAIRSGTAISGQSGLFAATRGLTLAAEKVDTSGGRVQAGAELAISTQNEWLNLDGTVASGRDMTLRNGSLVNSGTLSAGGRAEIAVSATLVNRGRLRAQGNVDLHSASLNNDGGSITANADLLLASSAASNRGGQIGAVGTASIAAGSLDNEAGRIVANQALRLDTTAGRLHNDAGEIASSNSIDIDAGSLSNHSGSIRAGTDARLALAGGAADNLAGTIAAARRMTLTAGDVGNRAGQIVSDHQLTIKATRLDNEAGVIAAADSVSIVSGGNLANTQGRIVSNGTLVADASRLDNVGGRMSAAETTVRLGGGAIRNDRGTLIGSRTLELQSGAIANQGGNIASGSALVLNTDGQALDNLDGTIQAAGLLDVSARALGNQGGRLVSEQSIHINSQTLDNTSGRIASGQAISLVADAVNNQSGHIAANHRLEAVFSSLSNLDGVISSSDAVILTSSGAVENTRGRLLSDGVLHVEASRLDNLQGQVNAVHTTVNLGLGTLDNRHGSLVGTEALDLRAGAIKNAGGTIVTGTALELDTQGQAFDNDGGSVQANGALKLTTANLSNRGGRISSGVSTSITSQALDNSAGEISAAKRLGAIESSGLVEVDTQGFQASNDGGRIVAEGALTLRTGTLTNRIGGSITSVDDASLATAEFENSGTVSGGRDLLLQSSRLHNSGSISAIGTARLEGGSLLDNRGGAITMQGDLAVNAGDLNNDAGKLAANGNLELRSAAITNRGGQLLALGNNNLLVKSLDNIGGRIVGNQSLTIDSQGGAITNDFDGEIGTAQQLVIRSGTLSNRGGSINGQDSRINSAGLDNRNGEISSASEQSIDTHGQRLDNSGGRIAARGAVRLIAGEIVNDAPDDAGSIASGGALFLTGTSLSNLGGSLNSSGATSLALGNGRFDNTGGTLLTSAALHLEAGELINSSVATRGGVISIQGEFEAQLASLDNSHGQIVTDGKTRLAIAGAMKNDQGRLATNAGLSVNAAGLSNEGGRMASTQGANFAIDASGLLANGSGMIQGGSITISSGSLVNADGLIASNSSLDVNTLGRTLNNHRGTLQVIDSASIKSGPVDNSSGHILVGQTLLMSTQALSNASGEVSAQTVSLDTHGAVLTNDTGRIMADIDLLLNAGAVSNATEGLIAANRDAKLNLSTLSNAGKVQAGQDLAVVASGSIANNARISAQRGLTLQSLTLGNDGATIIANSSLAITTGAASNRSGRVESAGTLRLDAESLDNSSGTFIGNADTRVALGTGALVNVAGVLASSQSLNVTAGATDNRRGQIVDLTGLSLTTKSLDNRAGVIGSKGFAHLSSEDLKNSGGILQAEADVELHATTIDNGDAGRILSNHGARLTTAHLDNRTGTISAATQLDLVASGALDNAAEHIAAGTNATISASSIENKQGRISALQQLALEAGSGKLSNSGGTIVAGQHLQVLSGELENAGGSLASTEGSVNVQTQGQALGNDGGAIQARSALSIASGSLTNQASGIISGQDLNLTATSLANAAGSMVATGTLTLNATSLNNRAGLIQAARSATFDLHGGNLDNRDGGNSQGIIVGGILGIGAGALDNRGGYIASRDDQTIALIGNLDNRGGQIISNANAAISSADMLNGDGGRIASVGTLSIHAGRLLDNRAGELLANGTLTLTSATLNNSGHGSSAAGSISARDIAIDASSIDNGAGGNVSAVHDASVHSATLDNTGGTLHAKGQLSVAANQLANASGQIVGDGGVNVSTSSNAPGGTISSARNVNIAIAGNFANTGLLSARDSLTISATNVSNNGTIHADNQLVLDTGNLDNGGEISATTTRVAVSGTLNNTGLIDGASTRVIAGTLNNTGRIYGDALAVGGGTINNLNAGVIAARDGLAIGAGALYNGNGGLIYAINDVRIGGSIDSNAQAQGSMATLLNASSTIEAGRDLSLATNTAVNRNDHLVVAQVSTGTNQQAEFIQPNGWTEKYPVSRFVDLNKNGNAQFIVHPEVYKLRETPPDAWGQYRQCDQGTGDSGGSCTTPIAFPNYGTGSPIFAEMGVPAIVSDAPVPPSGGCENSGGSGDSGGGVSAECQQWSTAMSAWTTQNGPKLDALQAKINVIKENNRTIAFEDYTIYRLNSSGTTTQIISTAPAKLLAGRDISLSGSVDNVDSQIVAGRNIFIHGSAVNNRATQGTDAINYSGTAQFSHVDTCGGFGDSHCRNQDSPTAYNPAPEVTHFDLPSFIYQANAGNPTSVTSPNVSVTQADGSVAGNGTTANGASINAPNATIGATTNATEVARQGIHDSDGPGAGNPVQGSQIGMQAMVVHAEGANAALVEVTDGVGASQVESPTEHSSQSHASLVGVGEITMGRLTPDGLVFSGLSTTALAKQQPAIVSTTVAALGSGLNAIPTSPVSSASHIPATVQKVNAIGSGERARDVILTVLPRLSIPTSNLFILHTAPGASYLIETDPRFTNGRAFLSSDYFLTQLSLDPSRLLKRYGDGFKEQQLINDQVLTLTGRRYLSGYSSTQDEYTALMDAGVAFAKRYQLTPGVALSAEQMALLTTDIVWLTTQTVTLPDGGTTQVLVPELYIRHTQGQDLNDSGSLIAAGNVYIQSTGGLVNSGTIQGDRVTLVAEEDLVNRGSVRGEDVYARAERDLSNLGGSLLGRGGASTVVASAGRDIVLQTVMQTTGNTQSSRTQVDRIATVQGGSVSFDAARDFIAQGAAVAAKQDLQVTALRNIEIGAQQGSERIDVGNLNGKTGVQGSVGFIQEASTTQLQSSFSAGGNAKLVALDHLGLQGSTLGAGADLIVQGATVDIGAAKSSRSMDIQTAQSREWNHASALDEALIGGKLSAGNNLSVIATNGNLTATGATLTAKGLAVLAASNDVTIQAATTEHARDNSSYYQYDGSLTGVYSRQELGQSDHTTQRTQVEASSVTAKSLIVQAGDAAHGSGDIKLLASNLSVAGAASVSAGRDVIVDTLDEFSRRSDFEQHSSSLEVGSHAVNQLAAQAATMALRAMDPVLGKKAPPPSSGTTSHESDQASLTSTQSIGSSISADSLNVRAGRDALIRGSAIVTSGDLRVDAQRNLEILTSRNQQIGQDSHDKSVDGLFSSGMGLTNGTRTQSAASQQTSDTASGSQVASLSGNVHLQAGETYRQSGSQVLALGQTDPTLVGDIDITAKRVTIDNAFDRQTSAEQQRFGQSGVTLSFSSPLLSALQSGQQMMDASDKTHGDARLQALAAATAGMAGAQAASSVADGSAASVGINLSLGASRSSSSSTQASSSAVGSTIAAARDLRIHATAGDIDASGAQLAAGRDALLQASGHIALQAAASTAEQHGRNDSFSGSIGVGLNVGSQTGLSFTASASKALGHADGTDLSYTNTTLQAGRQAKIVSGGDTRLIGAVVSGAQVIADVGGDLSIQSLQDRSVFDARHSSSGASVSLCIPPICAGTSSASASVSQAKVAGDFASVGQQSGIRAGDGGFQLSVKGHTDLQGGVIASTQTAVDAQLNRLTTASIAASDIGNRMAYDATGMSLSGGVGVGAGSGSAAGFTQQSGVQDSVTRSGVSQGALAITDDAAQRRLTGQSAGQAAGGLNRNVSSSQDSGSVARTWDGQRLMESAQAGAEITAAFGSAAARAVGDYADQQAAGLRQQASQQSDPQQRADLLTQATKWDEGGAYRVASHVALGGLAGGAQGAAGAGVTAASAPALNDLQTSLQDNLLKAGLNPDAAKAVSQVAGTAAATTLGAVAGGSAGAAAGFDQDANNRQLHPDERTWLAANKTRVIQEARGRNPSAFAGLNDTQVGTLVDQLAIVGLDAAATESMLKQYGAGVGPAAAAIHSVLLADTQGAIFVDSTGTPLRYFTNTSVMRSGEVNNSEYFRDPSKYSQHLPTTAQGIGDFSKRYGYAPPLTVAQIAGLDAQALASYGTAVSTQYQHETGGVVGATINVLQSVGQVGPGAISASSEGAALAAGRAKPSPPATGSSTTARTKDEIVGLNAQRDADLTTPAVTGNADRPIATGKQFELFTGSAGAQIPGAKSVSPGDPTAIASDARNMPNIASGSQDRVVVSNPYIPKDQGGNSTAMDYLPEAARVTRIGGEIVISSQWSNGYGVRTLPSTEALAKMGLEVIYSGPLLPELSNLKFRTTTGADIRPETMQTTVLRKCNGPCGS